MKQLSFVLVLLSFIIVLQSTSNSKYANRLSEGSSIRFKEYESEKKIDVLIDEEHFTSLKWYDGIYKPVLHPIRNSSGTIVTRGFPLEPRPGERPDHRHHVGNWLNYGDVNGVDFWGNGHSGERSANGGEIKLLEVEKVSPGKGAATIVTRSSWQDPEGNELLSETTEYLFIARGSTRIIDRFTTLKASNGDVLLNDTKEGMFAIRVARQLELQSEGEITVLDQQGNPKEVNGMSVEGISGNYVSSAGKVGSGVWGTRAKWMNLYGNVGDEKISLVICDHPDNQSYPTYWHARGYGLFSANPFGAKDFTNGKEVLNVRLFAGKSITFKYRLVISSNKHFNAAEIDELSDEFAKKY